MKTKRILTDEGKMKISLLIFVGASIYALCVGEYAFLLTCLLAIYLVHKYYNLAIAWHKAYENEKDASKRTIALQKEVITQLEGTIERIKRKKPSYGIAKTKKPQDNGTRALSAENGRTKQSV